MAESCENFEDSTTTKELAKSIKSIDKDTVHKICSGQVIISLATAVKELVENSVDAGATIIEIKLNDQGLEGIEVSDNGLGVEEKNFQGLTAKYHTSKLREFCDLENIYTFGFRGEALSSLCALSDMTIITKHQTADTATKLEMDHHGAIRHKTICARQCGTTVILKNLFSSLPVRKREFSKNIKKEFAKMCQILQGYCLITINVRIICSNYNKKGIKTIIMQTNGSQTIFDNIISVFGVKQSQELLKIKPSIEPNEKFTNAILTQIDPNSSFNLINEADIDNLNLNQFKFDGWISNCQHGCGRSAKDRQFYYINSRPCEPKSIMKIVNEIYNRFNTAQTPFVLFNICMNTTMVDVNLTPDKRQILVNNEKILLLAIRKSLLKTFGDLPSTYKLQNLNLTSQILSDSNSSDVECVKTKRKTTNDDDAAEDDVDDDDDDDDDKNNSFLMKPNPKKFANMLSQWRLTGQTDEKLKVIDKKTVKKRKIPDDIIIQKLKIKKIEDYLSQHLSNAKALLSNSDQNTTTNSMNYLSDSNDSDDTESYDNINYNKINTKLIEQQFQNTVQKDLQFSIDYLTPPSDDIKQESSTVLEENIAKSNDSNKNTDYNDNNNVDNEYNDKTEENDTEFKIDCKNVTPSLEKSLKTEKKFPKKLSDSPQSSPVRRPSPNIDLDLFNNEIVDVDNMYEELVTTIPLTQNIAQLNSSISTTIDEIKKLMLSDKNIENQCCKKLQLDRLKFKAEIDPTKNKLAENELKTEITKETFSQMEIIGQFNLGFIIARYVNDLFIIDQHATDEKYNFEQLEKNTKLQTQTLVIPQTLELTVTNEMLLMDNLSVFEMNGFKFQINGNAEPTKRIKLIAKPLSRNWEFGKDDIDELLFMLQDSPNSICRPSRVRSMFASRACRKSIMIGTPLSKLTMQKLINQMGEIEHPWNCPHGRPTMRHLVNLAMLKEEE